MRPELDEALATTFERASYAVRLAAEAYCTVDVEDEKGKVDPIHAYARTIIRETFPLAVIGLFALAYRASQPPACPDSPAAANRRNYV